MEESKKKETSKNKQTKKKEIAVFKDNSIWIDPKQSSLFGIYKRSFSDFGMCMQYIMRDFRISLSNLRQTD